MSSKNDPTAVKANRLKEKNEPMTTKRSTRGKPVTSWSSSSVALSTSSSTGRTGRAFGSKISAPSENTVSSRHNTSSSVSSNTSTTRQQQQTSAAADGTVSARQSQQHASSSPLSQSTSSSSASSSSSATSRMIQQFNDLKKKDEESKTQLAEKDAEIVKLQRRLAAVTGQLEQNSANRQEGKDAYQDLRVLVRKIERAGLSAVTLKPLHDQESDALQAELQGPLGRVMDKQIEGARLAAEEMLEKTRAYQRETLQVIQSLQALQ